MWAARGLLPAFLLLTVLATTACGGGAAPATTPTPTPGAGAPSSGDASAAGAATPTAIAGTPSRGQAPSSGSGSDVPPAAGGQAPGGGSTTTEAQMVELRAGQQYSAGTRVRASNLGLSFVIPEEWSGGIPQGSQAVVLGSSTRAGMVLILSQNSANASEVANVLGQPLPLDESLVLQPQGQPQVTGTWVQADYTAETFEGSLVGHARALVAEGQRKGILIVAVGPVADSAYLRQLVAQVAESTRPEAVAAAGGSQQGGQGGTALVQQWEQHLRGRRITTLGSYSSYDSSGIGGGYSYENHLYLCSDGSFYYQGSSSVVADSPGFGGFTGGQEGNTGTWRIYEQAGTPVLELRFNNGNFDQFAMAYVDGKTYFNQQRVYVTNENTMCP